ncbi:hypothetical protein [Streptomyces sp. NPDC002067]
MTPAALAIVQAALIDYDLVTPRVDANPAHAADRVVAYLLAGGYTAHRTGHRPNTFPEAAVHAISSALVLHAVLVAPQHSTPAGAAEHIAAELAADGWHISPNAYIRHNAA